LKGEYGKAQLDKRNANVEKFGRTKLSRTRKVVVDRTRNQRSRGLWREGNAPDIASMLKPKKSKVTGHKGCILILVLFYL
jgi:hypothetical protein